MYNEIGDTIKKAEEGTTKIQQKVGKVTDAYDKAAGKVSDATGLDKQKIKVKTVNLIQTFTSIPYRCLIICSTGRVMVLKGFSVSNTCLRYCAEMWQYIFKVVETSAWPKRTAIALMFAPFSMDREA